MRIGLFGGSFDPPHLGHLLLATYVLEAAGLEQVWWLPTWTHAFDKPLSAFSHRVAMLETLLRPYPNMKVNRVEERLGKVSYMIETVVALKKEHPTLEPSLLVGADVLRELPRWHRIEELMREVRFVAVGRPGAHLPNPLSNGVQLLPVTLPEISSTQLREALAAASSTTGLLARSVAAYVEAHGLYGPRLP